MTDSVLPEYTDGDRKTIFEARRFGRRAQRVDTAARVHCAGTAGRSLSEPIYKGRCTSFVRRLIGLTDGRRKEEATIS